MSDLPHTPDDMLYPSPQHWRTKEAEQAYRAILESTRIPIELFAMLPRASSSAASYEQARREYLNSIHARLNAWAERINQHVTDKLAEEERRKFYEAWKQEGIELADLINRLQHYDF